MFPPLTGWNSVESHCLLSGGKRSCPRAGCSTSTFGDETEYGYKPKSIELARFCDLLSSASEWGVSVFVLRLFAFCLILCGIFDKNRRL